MKLITCLLLLGICSFSAYAQVATLQLSKGTSLTSSDGANIVLDDTNLDNDGDIKQSAGDGSFVFSGSIENYISGKGYTRFDKLLLSKSLSSSMILQSDIEVGGVMQFVEGRFNIRDNIVRLGSTGNVQGESETANLFTTGKGYIEAVNDGRTGTMNPGNLGVRINSPTALGYTIVRRGHVSQLNSLTGEQSILRYYDVIPTKNQNLRATVRFQYLDAEKNDINESDFTVLKSDNGVAWKELGADIRNASANVIEKKDINQLSRFTIATPAAHTTSSFRLWPNPVINELTIGVVSNTATVMKLQIYNADGALVQVQQHRLAAGLNQVKLNMQKLPQGNYTMHTNWDGKTKIAKLSKM